MLLLESRNVGCPQILFIQKAEAPGSSFDFLTGRRLWGDLHPFIYPWLLNKMVLFIYLCVFLESLPTETSQSD